MKILVADDNFGFRMLTEELLRNAGHEPVMCEDGDQAWAELQKQGADLAILDVNMPGLNGLNLLLRIRADERFKKLPVLMLTVRSAPKDQVEGYEDGADDYLPKPFSNDVLLARITAIDRWTKEQK